MVNRHGLLLPGKPALGVIRCAYMRVCAFVRRTRWIFHKIPNECFVMWTCIHARAPTPTPTHTQPHADTKMHFSCLLIRPRSRPSWLTLIGNTHAHTRARARTYTFTHAHIQMYTQMQTRSRPSWLTLVYNARVHTHACTHARAQV